MNPPRAQAVVIGASAGAVEALSVILSPLPRNYSLPLLVVVHLPPDKETVLPEVLQARCRLTVREAEDKEPIQGGTVYLAPPDYHLMVETDRRLSLSSEERVNHSRPSVNVLFETAADAYQDRLVGIILTGSNSDGARGLALIHEAGGTALVQRPEEARWAVMPRAALDACPQAHAMSLEDIVCFLLEVAKSA